MSDNIRTDSIDLLCTKEDFIEIMDDNANLLQRIEELEGALRGLLGHSNISAHDCGDEKYCPVLQARAALKVIDNE